MLVVQTKNNEADPSCSQDRRFEHLSGHLYVFVRLPVLFSAIIEVRGDPEVFERFSPFTGLPCE